MSRNPSSTTNSKPDTPVTSDPREAGSRPPAPGRRRLGGPARSGAGKRPPIQDEPAADGGWFVYIVRCRDGTLYTGVTTDLERRVKKHNDGTGARYTRSRRPVRLVYSEPCGSRGDALRRELAIKALPRAEKRLLIAGDG